MGNIFRLAILIGILYLIFTNFGAFLMLLGGFFLAIFVLIYFVKKTFQKKARHFEFEFENFKRQNYQNFDFREFRNFDFRDFRNTNFQGNFHTKSKLEEAKEFFGFSHTPRKEEVKKRYKELAKLYHPDLNSGSDEKMKKLNEYKDILMQSVY